MNTPRRTSIVPLLEEIASLQEQFSRREADLRFLSAGGRIVYGIDNDVITAVTAPWLDDGPNVFGPLFTDFSEASRSFATIFAEYVFTVGPDSPFIIIPPAQNELEGLWNAVYLRAGDSFEQVEERFAKLTQMPTDQLVAYVRSNEAGWFDAIEKAVNTIHGGKSPATELRRITRLSHSGSLRRLEAQLDENGFPVAAIPSVETDLVFQADVKNWNRRLAAIRPNERESNDIDASVLALIEYAKDRKSVV